MERERTDWSSDGPAENPWARAIRGAVSPKTEEALRGDWKLFSAWCADQGLTAMPTEPETLVGFIDAMAETRAAASIRRYVASIVAAHRLQGIDTTLRTEAVRHALRRMHREKGRRQAQAKGLTWPLVKRMLAIGGDTLIETRNRAMLATGYDAMLRQSELVALRVEDFVVEHDGSATVLVRESKTDCEGEGEEQWLTPGTTALVQEWLARSGLDRGPLFRAVGNCAAVGGPLRPRSVARIFKRMAQASGLPRHVVKKVSGHSTRVGAAQDMVAGGISLPAIMQTGRWKSPGSVMRYAARMLAQRGGAAQLARIQRRV